MKCNICTKEANKIFNSVILKKYNINYYYCANCGFLQTEEPYWLNEAYGDSINLSDTGYMKRNINLSKKLTILISLFFNKKEKFLDYAGGYGVFTRMMRDIGFDFYWSDKYTSNLFSRGFEYQKNEKIEAVTTFESFEHFVDPIVEIENLLKISKTIIFSTEVLPTPTPKPEDWWYYGLDHGQHISFYSEQTFRFIADKYKLNYYNSGSLHILTEKKGLKNKIKILKLSRLGLSNLFEINLKSKTWEDHLQMKAV